MTPEKILARLEDLRGRRDEAVALAHSLDGAVQDCEFWLTEAHQAEETPKADEGEVADGRDPA